MSATPTRKPFYSQQHQSWAIPLTQGVVALADPDIAETLGQHNWGAQRGGSRWYAKRGIGPRVGHQHVKMHRVIMDAPVGMDVDHIVHYPLSDKLIDNRRANLRICSRRENQQNARAYRNGTSEFKGVSRFAATGKWQAGIKINGKSKFLGFFTEESEAAAAYDRAALEHFGEFANINQR